MCILICIYIDTYIQKHTSTLHTYISTYKHVRIHIHSLHSEWHLNNIRIRVDLTFQINKLFSDGYLNIALEALHSQTLRNPTNTLQARQECNCLVYGRVLGGWTTNLIRSGFKGVFWEVGLQTPIPPNTTGMGYKVDGSRGWSPHATVPALAKC